MDEDDSIVNLGNYLDKFLPSDSKKIQYPRVDCCGSSKSLYCTECFKLLLDKSQWPESILNGDLKLPFELDIILDDRRRSSSSLHAMVLMKAAASHRAALDLDDEVKSTAIHNSTIHMIDVQRDELIPSYENSLNSTFLLFPSPDSVPLSSVIEKVSKLVVLDCKWTRCKTIRTELRILTKASQYHFSISCEGSEEADLSSIYFTGSPRCNTQRLIFLEVAQCRRWYAVYTGSNLFCSGSSQSA